MNPNPCANPEIHADHSNAVISYDSEIPPTVALNTQTVEKTAITLNNKSKVETANFNADASPEPLIPGPLFYDDIARRARICENIETQTGPIQETIDCIPDYRHIFLTLTRSIEREYPTKINEKECAYLTPISYMGYCLSLIYGHALISDAKLERYKSSSYVQEFLKNDSRRKFFDRMAYLKVPPTVQILIESLTRLQEPTRTGIQFVHSLAGFLFKHDFGRAYPVLSFFKGHDLIALNPSSTSPTTLIHEFFRTDVIVDHGGQPLLTTGNYFGAYTPAETYINVFITAIEGLYSPVTSRSHTSRDIFRRIPLLPQKENSISNDINPYVHLLSAIPENIIHLDTALSQISRYLETVYPGMPHLGDTFSAEPSAHIETHIISPMSFPTWNMKIGKPKEPAITTAEKYAANQGFMVKFTPRKSTQANTYPAYEALQPFLYLRDEENVKYEKDSDADPVILFDPERDINPDVAIFEPFDYSPTECLSPIFNGLRIETSHISSFFVPQPWPADKLSVTNGHFLNSAIQARYLRASFDTTASTPFVCYNMYGHSQPHEFVRFYLGNASEVRLPYFHINVATQEPDQLPFELYHFHRVTHIGNPQLASNAFASTIGTRQEDPVDPNFSDHSLHAWSSYRYINNHVDPTKSMEERVLFILSMRTLYGTNVTVAKATNPFITIPRA